MTEDNSPKVITIFPSEGGLLDQALPEIFKNKSRPKPRQDSVTLKTLEDMVLKNGYCYTCSFTLDMKKKKLFQHVNDPWFQWRYLKNALTNKMSLYKFYTIMVPEKQSNGTIHCHGVVRFNVDNYFDNDLCRAKLMKYMSKTCARNLQWTRINDAIHSYMPTESNKRISAPQRLSVWHKYMHEQETRKWLGILDTDTNL